MKLEVGKIYENSVGDRVLVRLLDADGSGYPVIANKLNANGDRGGVSWYSLEGKGHNTASLVKEWSPPRRIVIPMFKWAAMDSDGRWFVYMTKPTIQNDCMGMWLEADEDEYHNQELDGLAEGTYDGDWKDSLHTVEPDGTLKPYHE